MGATVALDDFTEENGATYFLPRSHNRADPPSEDEFFRNAERFVAPAGSVLFFNARQWHSGGANRSSKWRHALTVNVCRPFMKQRLDIPRAMEHADIDTTELSERVKQKLGFFSQVPGNYDEYYLPPDQRKYRQVAE
jgi:ectoine hydroxylase-related dioxygenase (phytanoyl-CoA dioxygenase family)